MAFERELQELQLQQEAELAAVEEGLRKCHTAEAEHLRTEHRSEMEELRTQQQEQVREREALWEMCVCVSIHEVWSVLKGHHCVCWCVR